MPQPTPSKRFKVPYPHNRPAMGKNQLGNLKAPSVDPEILRELSWRSYYYALDYTNRIRGDDDRRRYPSQHVFDELLEKYKGDADKTTERFIERGQGHAYLVQSVVAAMLDMDNCPPEFLAPEKKADKPKKGKRKK